MCKIHSSPMGLNDENVESAGPQGKSFRLPRFAVPVRYEIEIAPDLAKYSFSGREKIEIDVLSATDRIVLNARELCISEAYVENVAGRRLHGAIEIDETTELASIVFGTVLEEGRWSLFARFDGVLNDRLKGFYRSVWVDEHGNKHTIATTQFESTDARRAFPCFDEPEFKATFKVSLVIDENLTAISNGRRLGETLLSDTTGGAEAGARKKRVEFAETMKMSTYLVCFIVGEFVSSRPNFVNGKEVRIWTVPGKEHMTDFALKAASFATDWYERYFEIPYAGGDKIDHIAIPDFASGAMENTGCITYRETALLVNEATATHSERKRVAEVVLHELAHMWFGDLVTMKWWNGLWLNESFATFMENLCLSHWKPEWEIWNAFTMSRAAAAATDSLKSTHPIESPVYHPDDAAELFDVISYEKGCSTLYQLHEFIGAEVFRRGIVKYLKKHSYGNTETHDLWDALEEACLAAKLDVPVRRLMDAWVFTSGHPVVEVKGMDEEGYIMLSQRPFKYLMEGAEGSALWPVPIVMKVRDKDGVLSEKKFVFDETSQIINVGAGYDFVVVNAGGSGFYRVVYDPRVASRFTGDLIKHLTVVERFNLINDSWSCVRARIQPISDYMETVKLFSEENDPNVWSIVVSSLSYLHDMVEGEHRLALEEEIRRLVKPAVDRLGWLAVTGENVQVKELRSSLISVLGTIGEDEEARQRAMELFSSWTKQRDKVDADIVPALVSIIAYHGDAARYEEFVELSRSASSPQETLRFLYALARFRDENLLKKTLRKCLSGEIRSQDAPYVFAAVLGNKTGSEAAWRFFKRNFAKMVAAYPQNGMVRLSGAISALDVSPRRYTWVKKFFATHKVQAGDMAISQALERLKVNVLLKERETVKLREHLIKTAS